MFYFLKFLKFKSKFYGHFISLGYNCENAYRFFRKYKFVESSLFTWCNGISIENLNKALVNFEKIATGKFYYNGFMWKDEQCNLYFHGIETKEFQEHPTKEAAIEYENELRSRLKHLKEKFKTQGCDGKKNLYTYMYRHNNNNIEQIKKNILELKTNIEKFCKNEFDLLIIFEKDENLSQLDLGSNIYIRFVENFAPESDVTTDKYDKESWNKIFKEFKPNFKLKKNKTYKFEER